MCVCVYVYPCQNVYATYEYTCTCMLSTHTQVTMKKRCTGSRQIENSRCRACSAAGQKQAPVRWGWGSCPGLRAGAGEWAFPKIACTSYLKTLVPKALPLVVSGARAVIYGECGPSGLGCWSQGWLGTLEKRTACSKLRI